MALTERPNRHTSRDALASSLPGVWVGVDASLKAQASLGSAGWDLRGLQRIDHLGAQVLWNHWGRAWPARLALTDVQRTLLERAWAR